MNTAIWAWIVVLLELVVTVIGYDLWAQATNHVTMSEQVHIWMQSQIAGPIVVAVWTGATAGLLYHFLINR